jgi:hypothetical protein
MAKKLYAHFRGPLYFSVIDDDGVASVNESFFGNAPSLKVTVDENFEEHMESTSGLNRMDNYYPMSEKVGLEIEVDEMRADVLAFLFGGEVTSRASGSFTTGSPDVIDGTVESGSFVKLARRGIGTLVIKDSTTPTAETLTEGVDYRIIDAKAGRIQFIGEDLGDYEQPFNAAYTYIADTQISMLANLSPEIRITGDLVNLANGRKSEGNIIHRVKLHRPSEYQIVGEKVSLKCKGMALEDLIAAAVAGGSPYFLLHR